MIRHPSLAVTVTALALASLPLQAGPSAGGDFSLEGRLTATRTRRASAGNVTVDGTPGIADPVPTFGGNFTVAGALVTPGATVVLGDFVLTVSLTLDGQIQIDWPAEASGYVLEATADLGDGAGWVNVTPSPTGNRFTIPGNQELRFFRLRRR
jgi:hypothetical protein